MTDNCKKRLYILMGIEVLAAFISVYMNSGIFFLLGIIISVSLFASILVLKWSLISFVPMIVSVVAVYFLSSSSLLAMCYSFSMPLGVLIAFCIRKKYKRAKTVLFTSIGFAIATIACAVVYLVAYCGSYSLSSLGNALKSTGAEIKNQILIEMERSLLLQLENTGVKIDTAAYIAAFSSLMNYVSFGVTAFVINCVSYFSTSITKLSLNGLGDNKINAFFNESNWQFVLSKASAIVFLLVYLCIQIGGETLTQPQIVAFYAVLLAISGGVLLMAVNRIRNSIKKNGNFVMLFLLAGTAFFLGIYPVLLIMIIMGLIATFSFKSDKEEG